MTSRWDTLEHFPNQKLILLGVYFLKRCTLTFEGFLGTVFHRRKKR
ncbi:unnamed protein product [Timema podura]|uniref:Uncharacterized protein n=1 Tax=Timema podura TaxID=61482 RepID=A0ABN7PE62_TIMPD|nr:unnamed protein product [Timema podura]